MKYDLLKPEIMLDIGDNTVETKQNGTEHLHIDLENWFGDDLLETSSFDYVVSERLKIFLEQSDFTGFEIKPMEITESEYFEDNYNLDVPLPKFYWMKIIGKVNKDDFYLEGKIDLYCSEKLLVQLKKIFTLNNLEVNPVKDKELDAFLDQLIEDDDLDE
jgi:hypothetical protein